MTPMNRLCASNLSPSSCLTRSNLVHSESVNAAVRLFSEVMHNVRRSVAVAGHGEKLVSDSSFVPMQMSKL